MWYNDLLEDREKALKTLAAGNQNSLLVLQEIDKNAMVFDPEVISDRLFIQLDQAGIRGKRIYSLYKTVCDEDLETIVTLLRDMDLGLLNGNAVNELIDTDGYVCAQDYQDKINDLLDGDS